MQQYDSQPFFVKPPGRGGREKRSYRKIVWFAIKKALRRVTMALGALTLILLIYGLILFTTFDQPQEKPLPEEIVIYLAIEEPFADYHQISGPLGLAALEPTLRDIVNSIHIAARDPRVKGLMVRLKGGGIPVSQVQELAPALEEFRAQGKDTWIYGTSYGAPDGGLSPYLLASYFDHIWMQPVGTVMLGGLRAEMPFLADALDVLGIQPQFFAREEYKTVFESLTNQNMSDESRQMMQALVDDMGEEIIRKISDNRAIEEAAMKDMVNHVLWTDERALTAGLVTELGDVFTLQKSISEAVTGETEAENLFFSLGRYAGHSSVIERTRHEDPILPNRFLNTEDADRDLSSRGDVALIYVTGNIAELTGEGRGLFAEDLRGSDQIARDIRLAADQDDISFIVLRVDSPGGSPAAAETIRQALAYAKSKDKRVVVSMGSVAASGGYWVATPAEKIFALPSTLTGSIGVAGGKFVLREMWNKLNVNWDHVAFGEHTDMWSFNQPFDEFGTARMNELMDNTYARFLSRVAEGRGMSVAEADAVAGGRVWTGRMAQTVGLVDELGGLNAALDYIAATQGLESRDDLEVFIYPRPKTAIELFYQLLEGTASLQHIHALMTRIEPVLSFYDTLSMQQNEAALVYQPVRIE